MNPLRSITTWTIRTWLGSLRWQAPLPEPTGPVVYCVWHRDIAAAGALLRRRQVTSLVSASRDGDLLVEILSGGAMRFARGSDSASALSGTRAMLRELRRGRSVATTWDGPKGPDGIRKPGPHWLAKASGAPLVELNFKYRNHLRLGDWSKLVIPLPGSTVAVEVVA